MTFTNNFIIQDAECWKPAKLVGRGVGLFEFWSLVESAEADWAEKTFPKKRAKLSLQILILHWIDP